MVESCAIIAFRSACLDLRCNCMEKKSPSTIHVFDFDTSVHSVQLHTAITILEQPKSKAKKINVLYALHVPDLVHLHYAKPTVERNRTHTTKKPVHHHCHRQQHNAFTSIHNHQPGSSRPRPCTHRILNMNFLVRNGTCAILLHIHGKCFSCIAKIERPTPHINLPSVKILWHAEGGKHTRTHLSMCTLQWISMDFSAFVRCIRSALVVVHQMVVEQ